jgi:hypothetical protein
VIDTSGGEAVPRRSTDLVLACRASAAVLFSQSVSQVASVPAGMSSLFLLALLLPLVHAHGKLTFSCVLQVLIRSLSKGFITSIQVSGVTYPGPYANDSVLASGIFNGLTRAVRAAPADSQCLLSSKTKLFSCGSTEGWSQDPTLPEMVCPTSFKEERCS